MGIFSKPEMEQLPLIRNCKPFSGIPLIDLSKPDSKALLIEACQEFGFFKVINHGVPMDLISKLEAEAVNFFSLPLSEKEKAGPPNPSGYGNKRIGSKGDVGWVEYLLLNPHNFPSAFGQNPHIFRYGQTQFCSGFFIRFLFLTFFLGFQLCCE